MPHLQFDLNFTPKPQDKTRFADAVVQHFGKVMDTGTDHVAGCSAAPAIPRAASLSSMPTFAAGGRRTRSADSRSP